LIITNTTGFIAKALDVLNVTFYTLWCPLQRKDVFPEKMIRKLSTMERKS
jgi:hypothetical protein